jgi:hypothetical protein
VPRVDADLCVDSRNGQVARDLRVSGVVCGEVRLPEGIEVLGVGSGVLIERIRFV